MYRTHTCGELRKSDVGKNVRISGWIHSVRDHGGVIFIDLRDHYGLTQVVIDPSSPSIRLSTSGVWKPSFVSTVLFWPVPPKP